VGTAMDEFIALEEILTGMWAVERENIGKIWEYGGGWFSGLERGIWRKGQGIDWVERAYIGLLFSVWSRREGIYLNE
jgi:hypothetical protein